MVTHYVYALHYNGQPFYIGMSINPKKRLHDHYNNHSDPKIIKFMRRVKSISDISIIILETYRSDKVVKCASCVEVEQKWILKYLKEGHNLINTVIAHKKYQAA